jgi:biopolymer transport protein ExbD
MAEIQSNEGGGKKKGGSKQKKISVHVDFTPMVDMNMLLITFFMLCTSLSKPQTMEISMPTNKDTDKNNQSAVKASQAITVLLTGKDSIFYYEGQPNYKDYKTLKVTSYKPDGLRGFLLKRNVEAVAKINDLKLKKLNRQISEIDFTKQVSEIKNGKKI